MIKVCVVYHSGYGHTKLQAEAVCRGAASVSEVEADLLTTSEASARLDELDAAHAIVFGCPTYMGNMSSEMKKFLETAVAKWFTQSWRNKVAGAFTNSSSFSGDKLNTLMGLFVNAMQHGMIFVGLGQFPASNDPDSMKSVAGPGPDVQNRVGSFVGPMAASFQVDAPGAPPAGDLATAEAYGRRVASIAAQLERGRTR